MILRIAGPGFLAGVVPRDQKHVAPIIKYMAGWTEDRIYAYAKKRGWTVERVTEVHNHGTKADAMDR